MAIVQGAARFSGGGQLAGTAVDPLHPSGFGTAPPILDLVPGFASGDVGVVANAITTASPVLGTPALVAVAGPTTTLTADPVVVVPVIGVPAAATAVFAFTANTLTLTPPVLERPTVIPTGGPSQNVLTANPLATSSPAFAAATLRQINRLSTPTPITTASPTLGNPIVGGPGIANVLLAVSLFTESPEIGRPVLTATETVSAARRFAIRRQPPPPPPRDRHIRREGDDYAEALANLLPQGRAWPREPETILMRTVRGLAQVWGMVDSRAADLLERESDPRTTVELLTDWERNWGLPDDCFLGEAQTIDDRHRILLLKMTLEGAQSREFFIWVALQLGYKITISEFSPFMVGVTAVGDTRSVDTTTDLFVGPFQIFR